MEGKPRPDLTEYIDKLVTRKLANTAAPAEDLLDELVRAREEGDQLSHDELISFGVNLLVAGHETSANQISSCVATLLRWPENWAKLVAGHSLVDSAIEELLWFNRFSEVGQLRVALEDVELHGVQIKAGEGVMATLNSANRDPRAYDEPDELRSDRKGQQAPVVHSARTSASAPSWPASSCRSPCSPSSAVSPT
ncbi:MULTISPECIES: cytochrome P450 [Kribbella]|uniref:cytochrome P450 n=1 Tax=Kribbella TaxID=182639 RepID=UPI001F54081D|nr:MULTISPECIES: cytochrome P450 [Kribbella]